MIKINFKTTQVYLSAGGVRATVRLDILRDADLQRFG